MNIIQWRLAALALVLALPAFVLACDSDSTVDDGTATAELTPVVSAAATPSVSITPYTVGDAVEPGPYPVGDAAFQLVDASRPTSANGDYPGSPERALPIEVWYPAAPGTPPNTQNAPLDRDGAPYPLIVFAHGFSSFATQSSAYTRHLASHGYVVVAPTFPLSRLGAPGGPRLLDVVNQPGDVSFVIDSMLEFDAQPDHPLYGAIDEEWIGLTGHSLGGFTTLLTVYGSGRDDRIDAALPISATGCGILEEDTVRDTSVPIMLLTGSEDLIVPPAGNRYAYELAKPPRYWVEVIGGNHIRFADFDGDDAMFAAGLRRTVEEQVGDGTPPAAGSDNDLCADNEPAGAETITHERQQELLRTFATPFFDAYLQGDEGALLFLHDTLPALAEDAASYELDVE